MDNFIYLMIKFYFINRIIEINKKLNTLVNCLKFKFTVESYIRKFYYFKLIILLIILKVLVYLTLEHHKG
jgi:hypothetical protein